MAKPNAMHFGEEVDSISALGDGVVLLEKVLYPPMQ
jgi:hypothetical protein